MRRVIFVAHHLTIGGIQKSLISALESINYHENEVTLYIRKKRLDLLPYINKNVKVIVNDDKHHYYRRPKAIYLNLLIKFNRLMKKHDKANRLCGILAEFIRTAESKYEQKKHLKENVYDVAVSYQQGYNAFFVDRYVQAKKKLMFYQGSTDETHEIHEVTMPNYDAIVVEHEDIKQLLSSWYDGVSDKIVILDNYTSPKLLREMCEEITVEKAKNGITLSTCARFAQVKGIDLAVEAAHIMKERDVPFVWYLVGDGPLRSKIEEMIEQYQLQECVVLTGMQKNPYPYMNASDIYVQPSYEEALSIAMLESQVLGLPMVSTKTAGGLAMIRDDVNGKLADIDALSLADAIEKLVEDQDLRKQMKENLLKTDYSKEQQRYEQGWRNLLED